MYRTRFEPRALLKQARLLEVIYIKLSQTLTYSKIVSSDRNTTGARVTLLLLDSKSITAPRF